MRTSELPLLEAWRFAISEINQAGGVLGGRKIEAIERDGKSYDDVFARQAKDLIVEERVTTLFGCWRSSCRKSVEEVCREYDHLLVYPVAYEGLEESQYVIYMGVRAESANPAFHQMGVFRTRQTEVFSDRHRRRVLALLARDHQGRSC